MQLLCNIDVLLLSTLLLQLSGCFRCLLSYFCKNNCCFRGDCCSSSAAPTAHQLLQLFISCSNCSSAAPTAHQLLQLLQLLISCSNCSSAAPTAHQLLQLLISCSNCSSATPTAHQLLQLLISCSRCWVCCCCVLLLSLLLSIIDANVVDPRLIV